jgi:hypothetical protein
MGILDGSDQDNCIHQPNLRCFGEDAIPFPLTYALLIVRETSAHTYHKVFIRPLLLCN